MEEWERLLNELRAELTLREQELDFLHALDLRFLSSKQSPEEMFAFIISGTQHLLQADQTSILLRRGTFLESMYSTVMSAVGQRLPIPQSLTGMCLETHAMVSVPDLGSSPLSARYATLGEQSGAPMRSLLAIPIQLRGTPVGVLNVESRRANAFRPVHERISNAIAAQIAIALQQAQMLGTTALFADVDRLMFASDDTQHVIRTALERVMSELQRLEHVQHSRADILFVRGEEELEIVHSTNLSDIGLTIPIATSVGGRAVRERKTVIVGDVSQDPSYRRIGDSIRSEIAVPILFGEDDIAIGALSVESEELDAFYGFYQIVLESFAEKVRTLLAFAKLRADVTEALELRSANDLLVAVGDQSSHMIHRLNNTVGAMRVRIMELQDMQDVGRLDVDFLRESLEALRNLAERTLRMPNEVTAVLAMADATVDVNECVRQAVVKIEIPLDVQLRLDLEDNIPPLQLYCFDIVALNLIQNAVDAMPDGGELSVSTSRVLHPGLSTGYFQLVVRDTGSGIPAEVQRRLFELNFTTKREKGKGLGFGLWWVRNFVRRARGDITIFSAPGSGTEVTVKIPIDGQAGLLNVIDGS